MLTKRRARQIREGIAAGRQQARFERMYLRGGPRRFSQPGGFDPRRHAPTNFPGHVAFWHALGRRPSDPSPITTPPVLMMMQFHRLHPKTTTDILRSLQ